MLRNLQLALIFILPVAAFAAMMIHWRMYGFPGPVQDYILRIELPQADREIGLPEILGPQDTSRPLIVLDPGHGGYDPGAGQGALKEKEIALRLARAIRDDLLNGGGIRVAMTRDEDRYLMLGERTELARKLDADLFLSLHADSTDNDVASGASVYVLSERGSSDLAARLAENENRADLINGVDLSGRSDDVSAILFDLSQREAQAGSDEMARLLLRELSGKLRLHRDTVQSAAFGVLKSPDMASVLFEMGFISNPADAAFLDSDEGGKVIAASTAQAVRAYFARRSGI